jgi:hypothetical protein
MTLAGFGRKKTAPSRLAHFFSFVATEPPKAPLAIFRQALDQLPYPGRFSVMILFLLQMAFGSRLSAANL